MITSRWGIAIGMTAAAALAAGLAAQAQEEAAPAVTEEAAAVTEAPAAEAPAAEATTAEAAEAPAIPVKPRPAEPARLAAKSLLLGIANTGKHLIAVGDRGSIVASNDGTNWAQVAAPVRAMLTSVTFADENKGWAVGHDAVVLHTADGGKTWQMQNFQPELEKPFFDVLFLDAQRGFAIGAYGLFMTTTDGGVSWAELAAPAVREEELHLNALTRLNNGDLILVGESGMMGVSSGGENWERLTAPYDGSLYGAIPRGEKGAVIYGLRGNAYSTDDVRANTWTKLDLGTVASFFGGTALPSGDIALVGLSGQVAIIKADGSIKNTKIEALAGVTGTGTLADAIPWGNSVLTVGELGVSRVAL